MQIRKTALALTTAAAIVAGTAFTACGNDETAEIPQIPAQETVTATLAPVETQEVPEPATKSDTETEAADKNASNQPSIKQTEHTRTETEPTRERFSTERTNTPTPENQTPENPTPTSKVHTQTGGSVIMQAPTSTPTPTPPPPPTPTATPVPGPYWKTFSQADYDQFLPPKGPIQWPGRGMCQFYGDRMLLADTTTDGIKTRTQWADEELMYRMGGALSETSMDTLYEEHPDKFSELLIDAFCGYMEALHPDIPVMRATMDFFVRSIEGWKNDRGRTIYEWDAYRVQVRYVIQDNPEFRDPYRRFVPTQLGPILIEKLNSPCDRSSMFVSEEHYCQTAP